jgi:hypothetical protein
VFYTTLFPPGTSSFRASCCRCAGRGVCPPVHCSSSAARAVYTATCSSVHSYLLILLYTARAQRMLHLGRSRGSVPSHLCALFKCISKSRASTSAAIFPLKLTIYFGPGAIGHEA